MNTGISLQQILHVLNGPLSSEQAQVDTVNVVFAWESDVDFHTKSRRAVPQVCLVAAQDFPGPFAASFAAGPDWINASVIPLGDDRFLVTIAAGRGVGNPHPSINVSHELDTRADVIVTRDLVTVS